MWLLDLVPSSLRAALLYADEAIVAFVQLRGKK
jgi:hypothetical protein